MKWTSKSLGSRLQHEFFYVLVRLRLVWIARIFIHFVVFYYTLVPSVKKRSSYYLKRRFQGANAFEMWLHCYRLYINFANVLLDRILYAMQGSIEHSGAEEIRNIVREATNKDTGCLIISAHVGAWQLGLLESDNAQRPINFVQFRDPDDNDKHYFEHSKQKKQRQGNVISSLNGIETSIAITSAIQRREIVFLLADRLAGPEEEKMEVTFLHGKIALPLTTFIIASITACPLLIIFSVREDNIIKGVWAECLHIPSGMRKKPELLRPYVERLVAGMESMAEKYPYQFFNFYDMWLENDDK